MRNDGPGIDLAGLLAAAEDASPAAVVAAAAAHLEEGLDAESVTFWIADAAGQRLLRLPDGEPAAFDDTQAGTAWREQRMVVASSVWVPVTVRGDALGVLEVRLPGLDDGVPEVSDQMRAALVGVAHCLGYVIVANQRHSDAYEIARRSEAFELSMEIQNRLLPQAFVCEGGSFTLAGWLEPSATAGGDTFDYIASRDRLTVTMIDAVGHDVRAAMLATLTVNSFRNARRNGAGVGGQAAAAHHVLERYADPEQYATGILLELPLDSPDTDTGDQDSHPVTIRAINAGHPPPRLVRNALQDIAAAFRAHLGGKPDDDATILILDWYGGSTGRSATGGADDA